MRKIYLFLVFMGLAFMGWAQNNNATDLSFRLNVLPDTAAWGDTLQLSGWIHNAGPGSFVIQPHKALFHTQVLTAAQAGTAARKPDRTSYNQSQGAIVIQAGDSIPVQMPLVLEPGLTQATTGGGGGGLDIVIIIWPSRSFDPIDPNPANNTDQATIYLKSNLLAAFTTALPNEWAAHWSIGPNPAQGNVWLLGDSPAPASLQLIDIQGKICRSWSLSTANSHELDLQGLPGGAYWLAGNIGGLHGAMPLQIGSR